MKNLVLIMMALVLTGCSTAQMNSFWAGYDQGYKRGNNLGKAISGYQPAAHRQSSLDTGCYNTCLSGSNYSHAAYSACKSQCTY